MGAQSSVDNHYYFDVIINTTGVNLLLSVGVAFCAVFLRRRDLFSLSVVDSCFTWLFGFLGGWVLISFNVCMHVFSLLCDHESERFADYTNNAGCVLTRTNMTTKKNKS